MVKIDSLNQNKKENMVKGGVLDRACEHGQAKESGGKEELWDKKLNIKFKNA